MTGGLTGPATDASGSALAENERRLAIPVCGRCRSPLPAPCPRPFLSCPRPLRALCPRPFRVSVLSFPGQSPRPSARSPTAPDGLGTGDAARPPRRCPWLYRAAAAGPWPADARLGAELPVCHVIAPSMGPHKPMFIHYPGSVSYRLFQRSQKQHLNSVTERHMTAFVFQNEPQHTPQGGLQLPPVPSEGGLLALAHRPQTGCPGAEKEASGQASLAGQVPGRWPPARSGSSSSVPLLSGHSHICLRGPQRSSYTWRE